MDNILQTAKNCRHYAMCKIDFLGTGICKSGTKNQYVSYYPQGRMDLYAALAEDRIPLTEKCVEIADTCDLCGKCDYQCYFVTEMKPSIVMKALKDYVKQYLDKNGKAFVPEKDIILDKLREIVGDFWATNDPAIMLTYSHDPCPVVEPKMPGYVIMPNSALEVSAVIKLLNKNKIQYAVRGNGGSVFGFVMSEGAVIDVGRMKTIDFDEKNWQVRTGAGVSSFDLQKAAAERGFRVNAAEASALVVSNIICTGLFSTFSASYGTAADSFIDAEFVGHDGSIFRLNDKMAPNLYAYRREVMPIPGVCTSADIRLHPVLPDEDAAMVPFESLEPALDFARECAMRRIGLAIGVLGAEYISVFLSPTKKLAAEVKEVLKNKLKMEYIVLVIGDKYAINAIKEMGYNYIDRHLIRILNLGFASLASAKWLSLLEELPGDKPFSYLALKRFPDFAEAALDPSPGQLVGYVDPELRSFFEKLYQRPEMTDPIYLNTFRFISSRMGREKHIFVMAVYLPVDNKLITDIKRQFERIAEKNNIKHDFGFITPLDNGKRCIFEYDYYIDHTSLEERKKAQQALADTSEMLDRYWDETKLVVFIRDVFSQGASRKEGFLYPGAFSK